MQIAYSVDNWSNRSSTSLKITDLAQATIDR